MISQTIGLLDVIREYVLKDVRASAAVKRGIDERWTDLHMRFASA